MCPQPSKQDKLSHDKELVAQIIRNNDESWSVFVEKYTDWVLYKSKEWCTAHCHYTAGQHFCGLTSLSLQRSGRHVHTEIQECDEGMDTYIWIFEQLRRRIKKYSGKNNCLLSTFVWTILNSRELHIDWLRWKYGRIF